MRSLFFLESFTINAAHSNSLKKDDLIQARFHLTHSNAPFWHRLSRNHELFRSLKTHEAFYCKFTTDAGAEDLIQAFVEANGGNEDTQINTWSIKFGQSQGSNKY